MIAPSPTSKIDASIARGTLAGLTPATATKPAFLAFGVPGTSYAIHLQYPDAALPSLQSKLATISKRLLGTIHAQAKRIDVVQTGGQYVEPVMGRPRRVQGTVVAIKGNEVVVDAGVPIHCTPTDSRQNASQFQVGQFVSFDVMDGARFDVQ
jgi:hypothetical protein